MTHKEVIKCFDIHLLALIQELYNLNDYIITPIEAHDGGRNVVFNCGKEGNPGKIIRISYLNDRILEDFQGETEYIRYLYEGACNVSNVIQSHNGNLVEEITYNQHTFFICLFEKAKGKKLVENNYQYRDGVPMTEYYYNCGKVLGKLHQLSKAFNPVHPRQSFSSKYNAKYIHKLLPSSLPLLKEKLIQLLNTLENLEISRESYGMVHFDFNDGNYMIDFTTGEITVYDFDNSCFCWYMFDLASIWCNGMGWIKFEKDPSIRMKFMEEYFAKVLEGYRSETNLDNSMLEKLSLFIQVNLMEIILDTFQCAANNGEVVEFDEELSYLIQCMEHEIPYMGFFHEIYSSTDPFCLI